MENNTAGNEKRKMERKMGSDPIFRFSPRPNRAAEINWREWGEEAFAQAEREEKMLLLSISAVWCHWCHVMDETTYSDPEVIRLINEHFIPVRVDNDRRPEINRRYNQGGWPSTVFLEPRGNILAGSTYIPPENMRQVIGRFVGLWRDKRGEISGKIEEALEEAAREAEAGSRSGGAGKSPSGLHAGIREDVWRAAVRAQDREYGGLGDAPKFPMFDVMELALDIYLDHRNPSALAWLLLTVDNMLDGGTYDGEEGGLFRYSTTRDWSVPHFEKMLADNARMARLLLRLFLLNGKEHYAYRAGHILDYVARTLGDGRGGFFGSQDADEHYYALKREERAAMATPFVDPTIYVDSEALAVEAFLEAGEILGAGRYRELGEGGLRLLSDLLSDESGMPHYLEGAVARGGGLLEDQAATLLALLKGYQLSGDVSLLEKASTLGGIILDRYRDGEAEMLGDVDRRALPAMIDSQPAELATASAAARGLLVLGELAGREEFGKAAGRILEAFEQDYPLFSFHAAPYARSVDLLLSGFRTVTLPEEGAGDDPAGLRRAAFLSPLPRLLVKPGGNNLGLGDKASNEERDALAEALEVKPGILEFEYVEKGDE